MHFHVEIGATPSCRDRPARFHGMPAHAEHFVEQMDDDADVIRNDPHLLAEAWTPRGTRKVQDAVLF